jgi:hypothetical protein
LYICDTRIDPEFPSVDEKGVDPVVKPKKRGVAKDTRSDKKAKVRAFTPTPVPKRGKAKSSTAKRPKPKTAVAKPATARAMTPRKTPLKAQLQTADFRVRELDPQRKCGIGTTVERLYRVDECNKDGAVRLHLVFLDRHGWYCEHGRNCPAVPHARKLGDRAGQPGPTQNGRMRA